MPYMKAFRIKTGLACLVIAAAGACTDTTGPGIDALEGSWGGRFVGIYADATGVEYQSPCYRLKFPAISSTAIGEVTIRGTTILHTSPEFIGLAAELKISISGEVLAGSVRLELPHGTWQTPPRTFQATLGAEPDHTGAGCLV